MRVIAGHFRSRSLHSLRGADIRPTSDRLRETLFDILTAGNPSALEGCCWIDLFAGTGAVGIEAISRGAGKVYFVEQSKTVAELIRRNLASLGISDNVEILRQNVRNAIVALEARGARPDFIFLDPPYAARDAYGATLQALANSQLAGAALIIAEHEKKFDPGATFGELHRTRRLDQGDASLSFYRRGV